MSIKQEENEEWGKVEVWEDNGILMYRKKRKMNWNCDLKRLTRELEKRVKMVDTSVLQVIEWKLNEEEKTVEWIGHYSQNTLC